MAAVNEQWASKNLGIPRSSNGPDLQGSGIAVEIKFCSTWLLWNVMEHQMRYGIPDKAYWGLGIYDLDTTINHINTTDEKKLEEHVVWRSLYIVRWSWMFQYKKCDCNDPYDCDCVDHSYRYAKSKDIPPIIKSYKVPKGEIHITDGVPLYDFNIKNGTCNI